MYIGILNNRRLHIPDDEAFSFAMAQCGFFRPHTFTATEETKRLDIEFVEWFYSGNWYHEEEVESA